MDSNRDSTVSGGYGLCLQKITKILNYRYTDMAIKRMFSKEIVESDAFLDMSTSAQALYFHLSLNADDYGVVSSPKSILRMVGCNDDDLRLLITKRFVLPHQSGVIVIKHWRINNNIRMDRLKGTPYEEVLKGLHIKENKAYTDDLSQGEPILDLTDDGQMTDKCLTDDGQMTGKCPHSLVQSSLDKSRRDKSRRDSVNHTVSNKVIGDCAKNAVDVDNSVENPVDNSRNPSDDEDGLIPGDRLIPASLSHSSSDFSICNCLSDSEWQELENRYDNLVGLLDYVDDAIRRREDQRPIRSPVGYISSIATQAGWPRKQKGGAESGK